MSVEETARQTRWAKNRWFAAAVACGVVLAIFPDIIFFGASFRNSRIGTIFEARPEASALIPEEKGRAIRDGYRDIGSAMWQLEPAHRFLRHCLVEGESPYWNPYSASGTHGPERLASVPFSAMKARRCRV